MATLIGTVVPSTGVLSDDTPLSAVGEGSAGTSDEVARADHQHPAASGVLLPSGAYVGLVMSENATLTPTKNREYCLGFDLAPQQIDRVAFAVTNTPDAGAKIRVGLRSDLDLLPGPPEFEEAVAADGGAGWKQTAAIGYEHPGGILWVTWTSQTWTTTGPILRGNSNRLVGFARPWAMAAWHSTTPFTNFPAGGARWVGSQDSVTSTLPTLFTPSGGNAETIELFIKRA